MIICVCRNIKQSDFTNEKELFERIMQSDYCCGKCQNYCQSIMKKDIDKDVQTC